MARSKKTLPPAHFLLTVNTGLTSKMLEAMTEDQKKMILAKYIDVFRDFVKNPIPYCKEGRAGHPLDEGLHTVSHSLGLEVGDMRHRMHFHLAVAMSHGCKLAIKPTEKLYNAFQECSIDGKRKVYLNAKYTPDLVKWNQEYSVKSGKEILL